MASVEQAEKLMTIEEYAKLPPDDALYELVQGRLVEMNRPKMPHGKIVSRICRLLDEFVEQRNLGHVAGGDAGIITQRDPDTVRGADVAFTSFKRLPEDADVTNYVDVAPEVVFEVRSPTDRWSKVLEKVAEYLNAGVLRVCVLDPPTKTIHVYLPDQPEFQLTADDELTLPELHADFRQSVRRFFP